MVSFHRILKPHRNVPLGVQYDTLIGIRDKQKDLPWCLTFHYKDFPEE